MQASSLLIGFRLALIFETSMKRERERHHVSWFCMLSISSFDMRKRFQDIPFIFAETRRSYLTNMEVLEIKNVVDEMLEMEEEDDEDDNSPAEHGAGSDEDDRHIISVDGSDTS